MTSVAYSGQEARTRSALSPWLFATAVFVSAALVFVVEPLVGKLLLPSLGGSPAIWNTSLAFFQFALLGGYGYAHALQKVASLRRQMAIHLLVLAGAALVLPLHVTTLVGAPWVHAPALWLALVLAVSLGPPFAALSATAPLLQAWYARLNGEGEGASPYRLYAASNLGSLLALATYPAVLEPLMGLSAQAWSWSLVYAGFTLFLAAMTVLAWRLPATAAPAIKAAESATSWRERLAWVLLAAAPSSLLTGVSAHITADVASVPFLWVLPLELYLATFVIAFSGKARAPSGLLLDSQLLLVPLSLMMLFEPTTPWPEQLVTHLAAFFVTALICHQTLTARRPEPARLTEFYLCLSVGGVIGGGFNAFLAPLLFPDVWEFPAVMVLALLFRPTEKVKGGINPGWLAAGLIWVAPLCIPHLTMPDILRRALMLAPVVIAFMVKRDARAVAVLFAVLALAAEVQGIGRYKEHHRSFFGVIHIADLRVPGLGLTRIMVHGTTLHGVQPLSPKLRCQPTAYYAPGAIIGRVFAHERLQGPQRIGVVGLGAGTVSAFTRPGDSMRFFEIDPLVERLTLDPNHFAFVSECAKGKVDVVLGDARLSLAREPAHTYDLLMIDAFSSDSVPTHLLTVEALHGYLRLLKPDGVLLLHLSNRNLELTGPAAAAARAAGAQVLKGVHWVDDHTSPYLESPGIVLLAATDPHALDAYRGDREYTETVRHARAWTDDYTNVWGAMIARFTGQV